jgi:uncharacterized protein with PQ loop repeat
MSEQQSGAGYPQPTSGQPQQGAYQQAQYASPQAQYQAQQQYAAYAQPAGPSLFEKIGVPSLPAILGLAGLAAVVLGALIAGTSDERMGGVIASAIGAGEFGIGGGFQSLLIATIVMLGLTLFLSPRLRPLWKTLTLVGAVIFLAQFLYLVLAMPDNSSDASSWIGAILLLAAFGLFATGVLLWLIYGLLIRNLPLVAANGVTLALATANLAQIAWYRRAGRPAPPGT